MTDFNCSLIHIENVINHNFEKTHATYSNTELQLSESSLDSWDYCYSFLIGFSGVILSTNKELSKYLDEIHKSASGASGEYDRFQILLGKLFNHQGDHIDSIDGIFKNRTGANAYGLFHRLLWGHDIFSFGKDNPFALMFEQKGLLGILQTIRHLIADTTSKQGLPLPGSSYLDFVGENGKTSNYLIRVAQQLSEESFGNKAKAQEIYAHMFTIRAQDVIAGTVVKILTEIYFKTRKIDDNIRKSEIRLIAFAVNFFGEAIAGSLKQNGTPYINVPLGAAMGSEFVKFCYYNNKELTRLRQNTDSSARKTNETVLSYESLSEFLCIDENNKNYLKSFNIADSNMDELFDFFGEDTK